MAKKKKNKGNEMSFLGHLEELRWHLVRSVIGVVIFMVIAFINYDLIFDTIILQPKTPDFFTNRMFRELGTLISKYIGGTGEALIINSKPLDIININMAGQFSTHIRVSLIAGVILASPYLLWEFWRFIKPALYPNERKHASGAVFFSSLLFALGVLFGYYLIVPLSVHFLGNYNISEQVNNQINLKSYIQTVTSITLAAGIIFELPIIVFFLSKVGMLTPKFMKQYRRHAYIIFLLLSAIITPPDVFSQVLVCIPLILLYEISIFISRSVNRKRKKEEDDEDEDDDDDDQSENRESTESESAKEDDIEERKEPTISNEDNEIYDDYPYDDEDPYNDEDPYEGNDSTKNDD